MKTLENASINLLFDRTFFSEEVYCRLGFKEYSFTDVYEKAENPRRKRHAYLCFCHRCGNTKAIRRDVLLENLAKTCGCARRYKKESKLDKMLEENSFELANAVHSNEK